jgi:hypothetical protein
MIIVCLLFIGFSSCAQENRYVAAFIDTKAYALAQAVEREDIVGIERLVRRDTTLLEFTNSVHGSNVLVLSINLEKYKSFKKLLELGANPNFVNPFTLHSVLIDAIQPFGSQFEWRIDNRYIELLLQYGADPNYVIENDFTNEKGYSIRATSPLVEASSLNLEAAKFLIKHGADPNKRIGKSQSIGLTSALSMRKFEIINYYIDTLGIDVHQPIQIRKNDTLFVQDFVKKFMNFKEGSEGYEQRQKLVQKLERMGVDFKHYNYKL